MDSNSPQLLQTYMPKSLNVDIYLYSCHYSETKFQDKRSNLSPNDANSAIESAFESALDAVGFFPDADALWRAYEAFLNSKPSNQRSPEMWRSFYHRVIVIPTRSVKAFWDEFSKMESAILTDQIADPQQCQQRLKETLGVYFDRFKLASSVSASLDCLIRSAERRCELWSRIKTDNLSMHVLDSEDYEQVDAWTAFLDFERANPMQLEAPAFAAWMERCLRRCLGCCQYSPDMWMYCIEYAYSVQKAEAMDVMERAIAALPNCLLLRVRICEFFEAIGEVEKADAEYRRLVKDCKIAVPWIMYQQFARRHFGIQAARDVFERARFSCKAPSLYVAAGRREGGD